MSLIKVFTEFDDGTTAYLPAKIISKNGDVYTITYLSSSEDRDSHNRRIFKYEDDTYDITDESITEFLNSDMEIDLGFKKISETEFIKYDSDSDDDYIPSEEDEDDSSDEESSEDEEDEEENDDYYESD